MRLALLMVLTLGQAALAQSSLDSLASASAIATARFADRRAAAAEGYRRLGADFPGMGEHWLHPGALLSGSIDANRPTILIYATIGDAPKLLGVGFVTTTRGDDTVRAVPGWPRAWHEHSGLLTDESGVSPGTNAPSGTHVWVLHAWTGLKNPDGVFTPDNWSLPFLRAGLAPPAASDPDAARAVALVNGGDAYLRGVLTDGRMVTPANAARVDSIIARARGEVSSLVAATPLSFVALRATWQAMSSSLRAELGPGVDKFLAVPHRH
ncbi:MAG: hypothetical protein ABIY52_13780 [Gemmatimonadaceae bacterium]